MYSLRYPEREYLGSDKATVILQLPRNSLSAIPNY